MDINYILKAQDTKAVDIQKALNYNYSELEKLNLENKLKILKEGRISIMEWLICKPKSR